MTDNSTPHFTPGPWKRDPQAPLNIVDVRGAVVAVLFPGDFEIDADEIEANANAIVALPALYAALEQMRDWWLDTSGTIKDARMEEYARMAAAALASARGEIAR